MPKLVATDLDGTIVGSDETVSARTHATLKRLAATGVTIVGITGRGPKLLKLTLGDIPSADFLVMAQGAFVYECRWNGDTVLHRSTIMTGDQVAGIVRTLEAELGPLTVIVERTVENGTPLHGDPIADWPWPVPIVTTPRDEMFTTDVVKTYVRSDTMSVAELLAAGRRLLPPDVCTVTESGVDLVEICPQGVDKGAGLAYVADKLGILPQDVLVFGDASNDLPMFDWAGRAVAMANAQPQVRAAADEITEAGNDEDGVAVYLENLLAS